MTTPTITIGTRYICKVGRNTVEVRATGQTDDGAWRVETAAGKAMTIRDAARLTPVPATTSSPGRGGRIKGRMSGLAAAAQILADRQNTPMNTTELVAAAREAGYWSPEGKTPAATLYSAILREIGTKGDEARFIKTARGKFALRG